MEKFFPVFTKPSEEHARSSMDDLLRPRLFRELASVIRANENQENLISAWDYIESNFYLIEESKDLLWPALGHLTDNGADFEQGLLQLALLIMCLGGHGNWNLQLSKRNYAYFGCHRLEFISFARASYASNLAEIWSASGKHVFTRCGTAWTDVANDPHATFRSGDISISLFNRDFPLSAFWKLPNQNPDAPNSFDKSLNLSSSNFQQIHHTVRDAVEMIRVYAPEYIAWIAPVLRGLTFVTRNDGGITSGTSILRPGLIFVSHPITIEHLAALIIHECSHQYFICLENEVPLTNGDRNELYFSPFPKRDRPLGKVLFSLHAAVNIQKFTSQALNENRRTGYIFEENSKLINQIAYMIGAIENSKGFTELGRVFFDGIVEAAYPAKKNS